MLQSIAAFLFLACLIYISLKIVGSEALQTRIARAGVLAPLLFMLIKASTIIIAPLGGQPLYLIASKLWGLAFGFVYLFLADTIAYITIFFLSRTFGRRVITHFMTEKNMRKVDDILLQFGSWKYLLIARFAAAEFAGYAAGLTAIPFSHYLFVIIPANAVTILISLFAGHAFVTNRATFLLTLTALSAIPAVLTFLWHMRGERARLLTRTDIETIAEEE